jgi:O-antigen/teichoic acid export membrane protein
VSESVEQAAVSGDPAGVVRQDLTTLAKGSVINLVSFGVNGLLTFAIAVVITRGLGVRGAGALFESIAIFAIVTNTTELGADTGLVRFIPQHRAAGRIDDIARTLWVTLVPVVLIGAVAGGVVFVFAPQLSHVFAHGVDRDALVPYLRVLAFFVPISSGVAVTFAGTRGFGTMIPYALSQNVGMPGLRFALLLTFILFGLGSTWIALGWTIPILLAFSAGLVALRVLLARERASHPGTVGAAGSVTPHLARDFWRFSAPRAFAAVFSTVTTWLDTLLLGWLRTTQEAGIYTAATRYKVIGAIPLQATLLAFGPMISGLLAQRDNRRAESVYQSSTAWLMALSWPVYLTLAVFAPLFLRVFGRSYVVGKTALLILALAMLVNMATGPVTQLLLMAGKSSWQLMNTLVALVLNVVLNLILIPRLGITGAAIAWMVSIVVNNVLALFEVWIFIKLHPVGSGFAIVALSSLACYGVLGLGARLLFGSSIPVFLVFAVVATSSYVITLWRFRETLELSVFSDALMRRLRGTSGGRRRSANGGSVS